jgi:nitronate monooxygenase
MNPLDRLGITIPIIQAPMAGVSTPAMAAAVSEVGGLGSIGVGATDAGGAGAMIAAVRAGTTAPFNVNLFVHATPHADAAREAAWCAWLAPMFAGFDAAPPSALREIYRSFADDADMLALLLATRPPVVSFHFGLPDAAAVAALKQAGIVLLATATNPVEARLAARAGIDMIVAQGIEAGGHRGMFDPAMPDEGLGTQALTRLLVADGQLPVIAAGGIMDGADIAAALDAGAVAAQLGTAFIACPESAADKAYREALFGEGAAHTRLTSLISGRPARCLANRFTALEEVAGKPGLPDYPIAYDAGKALHTVAKATGEHGFGAQWAGTGAPRARIMPASTLVTTLWDEAQRAQAGADGGDMPPSAPAPF